jgi:hypothetical protein
MLGLRNVDLMVLIPFAGAAPPAGRIAAPMPVTIIPRRPVMFAPHTCPLAFASAIIAPSVRTSRATASLAPSSIAKATIITAVLLLLKLRGWTAAATSVSGRKFWGPRCRRCYPPVARRRACPPKLRRCATETTVTIATQRPAAPRIARSHEAGERRRAAPVHPGPCARSSWRR